MSVLRGQGVGPPTVKVSFRPGVRKKTKLHTFKSSDQNQSHSGIVEYRFNKI